MSRKAVVPKPSVAAGPQEAKKAFFVKTPVAADKKGTEVSSAKRSSVTLSSADSKLKFAEHIESENYSAALDLKLHVRDVGLVKIKDGVKEVNLIDFLAKKAIENDSVVGADKSKTEAIKKLVSSFNGTGSTVEVNIDKELKKDRSSAIYLLAKHGNVELMEAFFPSDKPNFKSFVKGVAITKGEKKYKKYDDKSYDLGESPLHLAIQGFKIDMMKHLINSDLELKDFRRMKQNGVVQDLGGYTPLDEVVKVLEEAVNHDKEVEAGIAKEMLEFLITKEARSVRQEKGGFVTNVLKLVVNDLKQKRWSDRDKLAQELNELTVKVNQEPPAKKKVSSSVGGASKKSVDASIKKTGDDALASVGKRAHSKAADSVIVVGDTSNKDEVDAVVSAKTPSPESVVDVVAAPDDSLVNKEGSRPSSSEELQKRGSDDASVLQDSALPVSTLAAPAVDAAASAVVEVVTAEEEEVAGLNSSEERDQVAAADSVVSEVVAQDPSSLATEEAASQVDATNGLNEVASNLDQDGAKRDEGVGKKPAENDGDIVAEADPQVTAVNSQANSTASSPSLLEIAPNAEKEEPEVAQYFATKDSLSPYDRFSKALSGKTKEKARKIIKEIADAQQGKTPLHDIVSAVEADQSKAQDVVGAIGILSGSQQSDKAKEFVTEVIGMKDLDGRSALQQAIDKNQYYVALLLLKNQNTKSEEYQDLLTRIIDAESKRRVGVKNVIFKNKGLKSVPEDISFGVLIGHIFSKNKGVAKGCVKSVFEKEDPVLEDPVLVKQLLELAKIEERNSDFNLEEIESFRAKINSKKKALWVDVSKMLKSASEARALKSAEEGLLYHEPEGGHAYEEPSSLMSESLSEQRGNLSSDQDLDTLRNLFENVASEEGRKSKILGILENNPAILERVIMNAMEENNPSLLLNLLTNPAIHSFHPDNIRRAQKTLQMSGKISSMAKFFSKWRDVDQKLRTALEENELESYAKELYQAVDEVLKGGGEGTLQERVQNKIQQFLERKYETNEDGNFIANDESLGQPKPQMVLEYCKSPTGEPLIHVMARNDCPKVVEWLLDCYPEDNVVNPANVVNPKTKKNLLEVAIDTGNFDVVEAVVNKVDLTNIKSEVAPEMTPMHRAVNNFRVAALSSDQDSADKTENAACIIGLLLEKKLWLDKKYLGETPLDILKKIPFEKCKSDEIFNAATVLQKVFNQAKENIWLSNEAIVAELKEVFDKAKKEREIIDQSKWGREFYEKATKAKLSKVAALKGVVQDRMKVFSGGDVSAEADIKEVIEKSLSKKGVPLICVMAQQQDHEAVKYLLEQGADPNSSDKEGKTLLHYAVASGNANIAKECISRANLDQKFGPSNTTPFHLAARNFRKAIARKKQSEIDDAINIMRELFDKGHNLYAQEQKIGSSEENRVSRILASVDFKGCSTETLEGIVKQDNSDDLGIKSVVEREQSRRQKESEEKAKIKGPSIISRIFRKRSNKVGPAPVVESERSSLASKDAVVAAHEEAHPTDARAATFVVSDPVSTVTAAPSPTPIEFRSAPVSIVAVPVASSARQSSVPHQEIAEVSGQYNDTLKLNSSKFKEAVKAIVESDKSLLSSKSKKELGNSKISDEEALFSAFVTGLEKVQRWATNDKYEFNLDNAKKAWTGKHVHKDGATSDLLEEDRFDAAEKIALIIFSGKYDLNDHQSSGVVISKAAGGAAQDLLKKLNSEEGLEEAMDLLQHFLQKQLFEASSKWVSENAKVIQKEKQPSPSTEATQSKALWQPSLDNIKKHI